jgi:hypothetical protein
MKKKKILRYAESKSILFAIISFVICSGCNNLTDNMTIIANIDISTTPRHEWYPSISYNPIDKEFLVLWRTSGRLVESDTESYHSIDGQKVSPQGELLGDQIQISPPELGFKTLPKAAHNIFTNEYMVAFTVGPGGDADQQIYAVKIDNEGKKEFEPYPLNDEVIHNTSHPVIVFNSVRKQYLVAYNDGPITNLDNLAFILDENGNKLNNDPFTIGSASGIQFNPQLAYNATDDRYFANWEDFRHQTTWTDPTDIYGALLDGNGNSLTVGDIPICVDNNDPVDVQGDQRVQVSAYNPDKNEYLAVWMDRIITQFNPGPTYPLYETLPADIIGRIIGSDGTPKGEDFIVAGAEGNQSMPQVVYVKEKKMYFAVWQDSRNDDDESPYTAENDIYAKWLKPNGEASGTDIPICTEDGDQSNPVLAYNSDMDRFLIVWKDNNALGDYETIGWCFGHICETVGDIKGAVYGTP